MRTVHLPIRLPLRIGTVVQFVCAGIVVAAVGYAVTQGPLLWPSFHTGFAVPTQERLNSSEIAMRALGDRYLATIRTIAAPDVWQEALPANPARGHVLCETLDYPVTVRDSDGTEKLISAGQILLTDNSAYDDGTRSTSASGQLLVQSSVAGTHFRCLPYGDAAY